MDNIASDAVHCINTVKRFANEEHEVEEYKKKLKERYQTENKTRVTRHALDIIEQVDKNKDHVKTLSLVYPGTC